MTDNKQYISCSHYYILIVFLILFVFFVKNVSAAATDPFACDGRYYQTILDTSNDFLFYEINTNPISGVLLANLTSNGLPSTNANATAYNPQDNFIYMTARSNTGDGEGNVIHIYRIDTDGDVEEIGVPKVAGAAITTFLNAGAFLFNGTYIVAHGSSQTVYAIDLVTMVAINLGNYTGSIPDFAVHPITGEIYGWNSTGNILSRIELDNLNNPTAVTGTTNIGSGNANFQTMGAAYFDADGTMVAYGDDITETIGAGQQSLVSINVTTGVLTKLGTGPLVTGNDGASCPYYLDLKKTSSASSLTLGGTFYYTFEIVNASTTVLNNINFSDVLTDGFLWNSEPRNLSGGVVISATAITGTSNGSFVISTIPTGTSSFEIEVLVPNSVTSADYINTATLTNLPLALGSNVLSDDGATSTLNDATRTTINLIGDADGDGVPDGIDLDDDNDGLSDIFEGNADSDGDGLVDSLDTDSDNDGISDQDESLLPMMLGTDADTDGIDDVYDVDQTGGLDVDSDGIDDRFVVIDTDADGTPDYLDLDSDNDGYLDSNENGDFNNDGVSDHRQIDPGLETAINGHGAGSVDYAILLLLFVLLLLRSKQKYVTFIFVLIGFTQTAQATSSCALGEAKNHESCWYIGGSVGLSNLEPDDSNSSWRVSESNSLGFNVYAGYRFKSHWFAELDYADIGSAEVNSRNPAIQGSEDITYKIPSLFVGYILGEPEQALNFYGKLGISNIINEVTDSRVPFEEQTSTQLSLGAGILWNISESLNLRVDATSYDKDAKYFNIGVIYYFLNNKKQSKKSKSEVITNIVDPVEIQADIVQIEREDCKVFEGALENVNFNTNSYVLTNGSFVALDKVVAVLQNNPDINVIIEGYTDSSGPELRNYNLSLSRALSVKEYLSNQGVDVERLQVKGFGESRLFFSEQGIENRSFSRRVELNPVQNISCKSK